MNSIGYILKCQVCNAAKPEVSPLLKENESLMLLHGIFSGEYTEDNLPINYYLTTARALDDELARGFGDIEGDEQKSLYRSLRNNLYLFSAAKTYQTIRLLSPGQEGDFEKYRDDNGNILADLIGAYLAAEKDATYRSAKSAGRWRRLKYKSGGEPYLEYITRRDNRVRPAHVILDGIIRKKSDAFWSVFTPPNGWMCRCGVKKHRDGVETDLSDFDYEEAYKNVPPCFRNNPGESGVVFNDKHPYFKVAKELINKFFGLPKPHDYK